MKFLTVPSGRFRIGSDTEEIEECVRQWKSKLISPDYDENGFRAWVMKEFPAHQIQMKSFELSQTLVTNQQAEFFIEETGLSKPESLSQCYPGDHPVWGGSLEWATRFAEWMSNSDRFYSYRLPTEMEWEVAARGTDSRQYPYGNTFDPLAANTIESGIGTTTPVEQYRDTSGPYGHYDLAGNVEEWVSTKYVVYSGGVLIEDDLFERFGTDYFILRGGSFCCGGDLSRAARRHGPFPLPQFRFTGFRLVREPK